MKIISKLVVIGFYFAFIKANGLYEKDSEYNLTNKTFDNLTSSSQNKPISTIGKSFYLNF